jgi:adenine-specific DNA-methyltransferase
MAHKTKLELTWIGKDIRPRLEPRILLEDPDKSYHAKEKVTDHDIFDNRLIFGDNLLALKALEQEFTGKVKCIYIDPPYNTGAAYEHYDDGLEHSLWLSLIRDRLEILWRLLSDDGSLWVSIDDDEMPYLRVLMDEIMGRGQFVAVNVWQKRYSRENREAIGDVHEYVVVYAKGPARFKELRNKVPLTEVQAKVYKNPNNDPKGRWRPIPMTAQEGHATPEQFYEIVAPGGHKHKPPEGRCWGIAKKTFDRYLAEGRIYFGKDRNSQPNVIRYLSEVEGIVPWTWWPSDEAGHTDEAKKEIHALFGKQGAFDTPKPERLIHRIITIATWSMRS